MVDEILSLVSSPDRVLFTAEADAIGFAAAGSLDVIFPRLVSNSDIYSVALLNAFVKKELPLI
jgi:hypothetical protein